MKENKFQKNKERFIEGIDEEFQDLASQLRDMDFSKESNENFVLNTTLKNINIEGDNNMKKINKIKKTGIVAASLLIASTLVAQTTFAQEAVEKILKTISLGHVTMVQYDDNEREEETLADSLKGKVFDKNGKVIEKISQDIVKDGLYTHNGEKIKDINPKKGTIVTEKQAAQAEKDMEENTLYVTDSSKLNNYTCFHVKLPSYLPNGYKFDRAEFYKNDDGSIEKDSKYASLFFKNKETGKDIYIDERFACDETRTFENAEDIEKININGVDAILSNGRNINWEANGTIYFLAGKNITKDEAIKIAESIK
jgi:hypothetical protein